MDLAFLNSLTRHDQMPPLDPWMAGLTINYYYWGYLLAAVPAKLASVNPNVAYNLALPTFAGLSACPAACLGFRLSGGRLGAGLGAAIATVFASNVAGAFDALRNPLSAGFDYFAASRVIGTDPVTHDYTTISEFPFFTFFHADLHPHLLAFPFFIATFALAHRFVERGKHLSPGEAWTIRRVAAPASSAFLIALMAGTSAAASKWTLPAVGILLVVAGVFRTTRGVRLPELDEGLLGAVTGVGVFAVALALFRDYEVSYQLQDRGLGRTTVTSGIFEFLGVWGLMLAVCYLALRPRAPEDSRQRERFTLAVAAALFGSLLVALLVRPTAPVLVVIGPLALLAGHFAWNALKTRDGDGRNLFTAFLLLFGLAMIAGCEFIYFKDSYGERLQRMNTVFKFYNQAWPLLAIAAAVLAEEAWRAGARSRRPVRAALVIVTVAALLYPVECFVSRMRQRPGPFSLDGRSALARRNPDDYAAITWLEQNATPGSVVMEATGNPYSEFARIASHTGIPTVLGWANHEGLWRGNDREIGLRDQAVRYFYTQPDSAGSRADPPALPRDLRRRGRLRALGLSKCRRRCRRPVPRSRFRGRHDRLPRRSMTSAAGSVSALVIWYAALLFVGAAAFPLAFGLFPRLADRGFGFARTLGLIFVTYLLTFAVTLRAAPNGRKTALLCAAVLAAAGASAFLARRRQMLAFLRENSRRLLLSEAVFAFGFLFFLGFRALAPEIYWGEKPMDFSILNILVRTPTLPASDPWFSGAPLRYYTFGHEALAWLTLVTGLSTRLTFNLAFGFLGGATLQGAFALLTSWTGTLRAGFVGAAMTALLGNLSGLREWLVFRRPNHDPLNWHYFWATSRVIPDTVNEYPLWSFIFADLHAHVLAIPIFLLVAACALELVRAHAAPESRLLERMGSAALLGLAAAAQALTNAWDAPLLAGLLLLIPLVLAAAPAVSFRAALRALASGAVSVGVVFAAAWRLWPRGSGPPGFGRNWEPTPSGVEVLNVFGLFFFLLLGWWLVASAARLGETGKLSGTRLRVALLLGAAAALTAAGFASPVALCGIGVGAFFAASITLAEQPEDRLAFGFAGTAFFLVAFALRLFTWTAG